MQIRKAEFSDLDRLMQIYEEAAAAIGQLGIDQWQDGYPQRELILSDISQGVSYVAETEQGIQGVLALFTVPDPTYAVIYEGTWKTSQTYGTIHRIAISDSCRGSGLADSLFDFCEKFCLDNNIFSLRIDTHEGNLRMRKAVEKNGFEYCGIILLENGDPRVAYEKILR